MPAKYTVISESTINDDPDEFIGYANLATATATAEEFIIHFGRRSQDDPNVGTGVAKIYLTLPHAKRLAMALARVIQGHEDNFGEIQIDIVSRLTPEARKRLKIDQEREGKQ